MRQKPKITPELATKFIERAASQMADILLQTLTTHMDDIGSAAMKTLHQEYAGKILKHGIVGIMKGCYDEFADKGGR